MVRPTTPTCFGIDFSKTSIHLGLVGFERGDAGTASHVANPFRSIGDVLGTEVVPAEGMQDSERVGIGRGRGRDTIAKVRRRVVGQPGY